MPKFNLRPMDSEFKRLMSPPLALITLASLTPKKHEVYIEDENIKSINFNDTPDLVGITVNVDTAHKAYQITGFYKKNITSNLSATLLSLVKSGRLIETTSDTYTLAASEKELLEKKLGIGI